jgi:asparagine synthase (glutamine-hydrolysing)
MCGVVGFISKEPKKSILESMLEIQSYRGPDDRGLYIDNKFGLHLGHNRLSIQDISADGHQPFISDCGKYIIVFNGEVYNFKSIRAELKAIGYNFVSNSDTEVILYSYKEWGIDSIEKFIGMFAFAIYDIAKEKLFLVRDRAGVKPLYFVDGESFLFSSEIKSFHKHPDFKKEINREILPYYFQFAYIPTPYTIYKGCQKLEAGHYMEYDLKRESYQIHKYWDINDFYLMDNFNKDEDEIVDDIEKLLIDSCNLRMVSDVPVGVFLSGGYDSSTVVALLQKNRAEKINTFTIGFQEKEFNEAVDAKSISKYLGTNHTEYYCTQDDMLDLVADLANYWDEPFGDASALPTMIVSRLAKKDVTVALSADGGDEVFFGYSKYFAIEKMQSLKSSKIKRKILKTIVNTLNESSVLFINSLLPKSKRQANIVYKFKKFKSMINAENPKDMFIRASSKIEADFLDETLVDGSFKNFEKTAFKDFKNIESLSVMNQMMAMDYKTFMVDDVLCKVDRATMSVSLEGREPLLDHRIAEYMARVPSDIKYKNQDGKYLLRKVLNRYIPKEMTDRPKSGFTIPLKYWLENELKEEAIECLSSRILIKDSIFKEKILENLIEELKSKKVKKPTFIWMIMVYVKWRNRWE